jgi:TRIAP1/MDM35 family protein
MESVGPDCTQLKRDYDSCFINWFSEKFLKGDKDDSVCAPLLEVYKQCVQVCVLLNHLPDTAVE